MQKSPDQIFAGINNTGNVYSCQASRHVVEGRMYDYWEGNTVKTSTKYNVVDYDCGSVPNGNYDIFLQGNSDSVGNADVSQYNKNYDQNSSGTISYGITLLTNNIANHFPEASDKWKLQIPKDDNINSSVSGSANNLPIVTKADHSHSDYVDAQSKARAELDGYFTYVGEQDPDAPTTIYVDYHAGFHMHAYAPFNSSTGGGDAYSEIKIGINDATPGSDKTVAYGKSIPLHADSDHQNLTSDPDIKETMSFKPEKNHVYYIYFNMVSKECCLDTHYAETNLNTVFHVNIRFTD